MHAFLNKQNINYGIYLIEPAESLTFNRGLLINIGFMESIFDTLPSNDWSKKRENGDISNLDLKNSYWDCKIK